MSRTETAAPAGPGRLRGKVALVTGGASGIGRATALLFAREGAAVAVADRDEAGAAAAAHAIEDAGGRAVSIACDVTRDADCRRAVEETVRAFAGLHILFNNAGIIRRATVAETTEEDWDSTFAVNVKGIYLMSRHAVPVMARGGGGTIVNTASNWGLVGGARAAAYIASKGAVVLLTKAMAIDHGAAGIRVNCVCPGDTDTAMLRSEAQQLGEPYDLFLKTSANNPLRRVATTDDIARAVLWLAGDAASFVTGAPLVVDGGFMAGQA
jgi:NAD(P)-dependent dehydrogenase (short-subunit alcohol dehydrogenase family)